MGTRGMWGYVIDGEEKFTYNHFDSYPECLGSDILSHLRSADHDELRQAVRELMVVDDETPPTPETQKRLVEIGAYNGDVSTGQPEEWYSLLRNTQGDPEAVLAAGFMEDGHEFASDSLFCEWAYVVDLDQGTFEIYRGFQTEPHNEGRFADRVVNPEHRKGFERYYPVRLLATFKLNDLPEALPNFYDDDE